MAWAVSLLSALVRSPRVRRRRPHKGVHLAAQHSLVGFRIVLRDRYPKRKQPKRHHPLSATPTTPSQDVLMAVSAFFESFHKTLDSHKDTYFGEVTDIDRRGRTIAATMNAGRGGLESMLSDPARSDEPGFRRERRHVERVPIRQLVVIPKDSLVGYWIIEAVGLRTLSQAYREAFRRAFGGRFPQLSIKFEHIVHADAWTAYEENENAYVEEVRIVRNRVAEDRAEAMGIGDVPGEYIEIVQTTTAPRGGGGWLRRLRETNYDRNDEGKLVPKDENLTEVSARIRIGDRETDVVIDREKSVGMRVLLDTPKDKRPSDSYVHSKAREWVVDLATQDDVLLPKDWAKGKWKHDKKFGRLGADDASDQEANEQDPDDGTAEGARGDADH